MMASTCLAMSTWKNAANAFDVVEGSVAVGPLLGVCSLNRRRVDGVVCGQSGLGRQDTGADIAVTLA